MDVLSLGPMARAGAMLRRRQWVLRPGVGRGQGCRGRMPGVPLGLKQGLEGPSTQRTSGGKEPEPRLSPAEAREGPFRFGNEVALTLTNGVVDLEFKLRWASSL